MERFYIFDSDGNTAMADEGYATLEEAVLAAGYMAVFIWHGDFHGSETATVGRGKADGLFGPCDVLAHVEARTLPERGRVRLGDRVGGARVPRVTYTAAGLDALTRAMPHATLVCQGCGSHDVLADAWVDAAGVPIRDDGPLGTFHCNACGGSEGDMRVLTYEHGETIPPHAFVHVTDLDDNDTHRTTLAEFLADNIEDEDSCAMISALKPGESIELGGGAAPRTRITREKDGAS